MNKLGIVLLSVSIPRLFAGDGVLPAYDWSKWDLSYFSSHASSRMGAALGNFQRLNPPEERLDEVLDRIARNEDYRLWVQQFFANQPVTFENESARGNTLWVLEHLRAEWAVRFLMELGNDQRPMTSSKYDYDSPEFIAELKALVEESPEAALDFAISSGFQNRRTNAQMATSSLYDMKLAGAPAPDHRRLGEGPTVMEWLHQPSQRNRIPEIVKATWGEKAVLNIDLGLGPDNKPLGDGDPDARAKRERLPLHERFGSSSPEVEAGSSRKIPWFLLGGALLILAAALGYLKMRKPFQT